MTAYKPLQVQAFYTANVAEQIRATPGWVQQYQQMSSGHFAGRIRYLDLQGVEIYEEQMNTRIEQSFSPPEGSLAFCFDRNNNSLYVLNGESHNIWITPENYHEVAVVFGPAFVKQHGLEVALLEDLYMSPLSSQQNALFSCWLSGTLTRLSQTMDPPSKELLTRQLLEDCLYILDNACMHLDRACLRRWKQDRKLMKRVAEWAADTPEETLNLLQLSRVAGVSLRQLQQAFKAYTGMTPTHWLRLRRLNSARRELLSRTTEETTIAQVAMRWSFWHLGRFSSSYQALFQELPSQTLARQYNERCRRTS